MIGLEFSAAVCSLTPERIDVLRAAGVHEGAIFHDPLMVGMAPIQTHRSGLFDLDATGDRWAALLPCGEHDGLNWQLEDIVAFFPDQPARWWRRRGAGVVLGALNAFSVDPQRLHQRPLDWLNDAGRGLCIIDWSRNPLNLLLGAGHLVADLPIQTKLRALAVKAAAARTKELFQHG